MWRRGCRVVGDGQGSRRGTATVSIAGSFLRYAGILVYDFGIYNGRPVFFQWRRLLRLNCGHSCRVSLHRISGCGWAFPPPFLRFDCLSVSSMAVIRLPPFERSAEWLWNHLLLGRFPCIAPWRKLNLWSVLVFLTSLASSFSFWGGWRNALDARFSENVFVAFECWPAECKAWVFPVTAQAVSCDFVLVNLVLLLVWPNTWIVTNADMTIAEI